jgi:hypothetical protein
MVNWQDIFFQIRTYTFFRLSDRDFYSENNNVSQLYSKRQKYGINSLKIKQIFFKQIFGQVNFSFDYLQTNKNVSTLKFTKTTKKYKIVIRQICKMKVWIYVVIGH